MPFRSQKTLGFACLSLLAACMPSPSNSNTEKAVTGAGSAAPATAGSNGMTGGTTATGAAGMTAGSSASAAGSSAAGSSASGSGGAPEAGGASGAAGSTANDSGNDLGNFFKSGAWMGYVWTSTSGDGSSITPMDFEAQTTGMPRCVSGTVAAQADFGGTAILGFNINEGGAATGMPVAPTHEGVTIEVTNNTSAQLRLQVQTASTGGTQWCTTIVGSGGYIPWGNLRTACWGPTGTKYNREPIVSVMVLVPGDDVDPVAFDFCVNVLAEADGPADGTAGSGAAGMDAAGSGGTTGTTDAGMGDAGI